jgi:hypothetical protein
MYNKSVDPANEIKELLNIPKRIPIKSEMIKTVKFQQGNLEVEFNNGDIYRYLEVSLEIYNELKTSSSPGRFLNKKIKNEYNYEKIFDNSVSK